jgi:hypothetical protein
MGRCVQTKIPGIQSSTIKDMAASQLLDSIAENGRAFLSTKDNLARQQVIAAAESLIRALEKPGE